tara:strand:- start:4623 stop:4892 length:270 start_codon:yes stop_codon:yes gene_type:complete
MKIMKKSVLALTTIVFLSGCDAQTMQYLNDLNNALYGTSTGSSYGNSSVVGFKTGETISGFNKICYYNKLGSVYTINIPNTSLCPLTIR